ncbi:aldose 1-epimerase [Paenibacillus spongiae]|uniref:Aldose 1-epimerase n=1 Tax=Paenibacillus spongiae TaxID=2909671 RepID=A0ABY5S8D0_9BACL|nr:aldose 1-epimerase [Paenibacillus spongiae]UVI28968.1 aldose 1-epimerase [Paenibacillus spongiae]
MTIYRHQRNYGCRIHDQYTYLGMRVLVLENEKVRISLLPDKGTEIFEFLYKPVDLDFMWLTENGVHNPNSYLPTSPDPISTFIDYYAGGWQEVFPNGGSTSSYLGARFGQHGEVAHMPWDVEVLEDSADRIRVLFRVRTKKVPFELRKTLTLQSDSSTLRIEEELENLSDLPLRFMWGHHIAFGKPFLEPGCRINLPEGLTVLTEERSLQAINLGRVRRGDVHEWPVAADEQGAAVDLSILPARDARSDIVYVTGFEKSRAWYEVENGRRGMGIRVEWDASRLPYLWYWQEFGETKTYPWYGRHYNVGLEPFSGYPTHGIEKALENESAGSIGPSQTISSWLTAAPYPLNEK